MTPPKNSRPGEPAPVIPLPLQPAARARFRDDAMRIAKEYARAAKERRERKRAVQK